MNTAPSRAQQELGDTAAQFLAKQLGMAQVRNLATQQEASIDDSTWSRMSDLGWFALAVDEAVGGVGLGLPEQVMVFREVGRHLTPGPLLGTCVAASLLQRTDDAELLEAVVGGEARFGMRAGGVVVDARPGDYFLEISENSTSLVRLDSGIAAESVDPGVRLMRATGETIVHTVAGTEGFARASVLAAASLLGIIETVRDLTADYARTRIQFGKPIGTFQAVKHRCADMAIAAYAAISQVCFAALYVENQHPGAAFEAACAYRLAGAGARRSTADAIQNFGGIGFTSEHDAHLYLKRALLMSRLLDPAAVRNAVLAPPRHDFDWNRTMENPR